MRSYPASTAAVRSSSLRGHSRPFSSPPMHLIAAAVITPSGVPPIPHRMSTGVLSVTASKRRRDVAVEDQPDARAGLANLCHRVVVALAVEHHDHHVADVDLLALGDQRERLG